ncbi:NAD-dependent epimerase/dehydratase family protein [Lactiplantibacillus plantarum]|nr:NAD-dependent epimerase/dehydratase family protein [Lactiplantibacillus plantarum]
MKVFITGGTGFVGSAVVQELVANGFEVVGLARSETSAQKLISWGAQPVRGSLTSLSTLATAAA